MPTASFEIRICDSCGLRYPLAEAYANAFGIRCPACLGETRVALSRRLVAEPTRDYPGHSISSPGERGQLAVLLDNIRSAWNVGSILRSADGFGFAHAYLCGVTPTPDGPSREAVRKTSLGAEDSVPCSYHKDALRLMKELKKEGWSIIALEEDERAIEVHRIGDPTGKTALIVGNEVTGVDPELLDLCDSIYYIPMHGQKRSFNVAIAFGIAAYAMR